MGAMAGIQWLIRNRRLAQLLVSLLVASSGVVIVVSIYVLYHVHGKQDQLDFSKRIYEQSVEQGRLRAEDLEARVGLLEEHIDEITDHSLNTTALLFVSLWLVGVMSLISGVLLMILLFRTFGRVLEEPKAGT